MASIRFKRTSTCGRLIRSHQRLRNEDVFLTMQWLYSLEGQWNYMFLLEWICTWVLEIWHPEFNMLFCRPVKLWRRARQNHFWNECSTHAWKIIGSETLGQNQTLDLMARELETKWIWIWCHPDNQRHESYHTTKPFWVVPKKLVPPWRCHQRDIPI